MHAGRRIAERQQLAGEKKAVHLAQRDSAAWSRGEKIHIEEQLQKAEEKSDCLSQSSLLQ
ncbi:MAG TPA: hypothetical protein PKW99_13170 [Thauera sp.]|jgi:hypothetical protein|nr:hypothetical protein [Thauera sp.]